MRQIDVYQMDIVGLTHFTFAIFSMVFGALIIFVRKGDQKHKIIGYAYCISMLGVNATALVIYKLFDFFGPFHVFALISLLTIGAGFFPVYFKKPEKDWLEYHYEFMNWSVVGLYAAFWSETFTRFFEFSDMAGFWYWVGTATAITVAVGAYFIKKKKSYLLDTYRKERFKAGN